MEAVLVLQFYFNMCFLTVKLTSLPSVLCKSRRIRQEFSDQRSQLLRLMYSIHQGRKITGLNLNMADEMWCVWLKGEYANDYQQTLQTLLAIFAWLAQPRINNFMTFAPLTPFPYQKNTVNSWFSLSADGELRQQAVNVINVDENGKMRECYTTQYGQAFPGSLSNEEYEVFFHGTRYTSAKDIIESNIELAKGKLARDFSSGDGFYICNKFDQAFSTRWASNRPPCSAVLVFRVRTAELRPAGRRRLDLQNDIPRWQEVVRLFRTAEDNQKSRRDMKNDERALRELKLYDFIEGPIASEGQNFSSSSIRRVDGSYQLCVKSDICAELFSQSLHSVVFFPETR